MEQAEWFPSAPDNARNQPIMFVSLSTVDDLSYSPSEGEKSRDVAQVAATGRRSWKTLKGKPEAVWPPLLEAALIEALEAYRRVETHPTTSKHGFRYPMRNRFVSDYIYEKTSKVRTAKQVGSRLQQLRDTCKDPGLLELLARSPSQEPECKTESERSPPLGSRDVSSTPPPTSDRPKFVVYTQINIQSAPQAYQNPRIQFVSNEISNPLLIYLLPYAQSDPSYPSCSLSSSRRGGYSTLSQFSNTIEFCSPWALAEETVFSIYKDSTLVHKERGLLHRISNSGWIYSCNIIPSFWSVLCDREDPNRMTILQVVTPSVASSEPNSLAHAMPMLTSPGREISVVYHFNLPQDPQLKLRPVTSMELRRPTSNSTLDHPPRDTTSFNQFSPYPEQGMGQGSSYWPSGSQDMYRDDAGYSRGTGSFHHSHMGGQTPVPDLHQHGELYMSNPRAGDRADPAAFVGTSHFEPDHAGHMQTYGEPRSNQWPLSWRGNPPMEAVNHREALSYTTDYASCY